MELETRDEREIRIEDSIAYTMARLKKVLKRQGMGIGVAKAYTNLGWAVTFFNDEFIVEAWMEREASRFTSVSAAESVGSQNR